MLPGLEVAMLSSETLKLLIFDLTIAARGRHDAARLAGLARTIAQHLKTRKVST
jgi:hypothetical protein